MTIIDIALSQVGIFEKPINSIIYNDEFYGRNVNGVQFPWCVTFIWWCSTQSKETCIPKMASVIRLLEFAVKNKSFQGKEYSPRVGDIFIQKQKNDSHAGFVLKPLRDKFWSVEGNLDHKVSICERFTTENNVVGFFTPSYINQPKWSEDYDRYYKGI